jgi:nucleotide-binding universal stress UspA family protein
LDVPPFGAPLLVPFDGSANAEAVLPFVPLLVDGGRDVVLLQVVPEARDLRSALGDVALPAETLYAASETAARADLERAAAKLLALAPALRIEESVVAGDPSERIVEEAAARGAHGIVIASQGVSAVGPGGFGSVAGRVARTAPVPVLIVQPGAATDGPAVARFVVAHDGSERAGKALPVARDLARRLSAHLHVVAVVNDERSPIAGMSGAGLDPHILEMFHGDARRAAQHHVESVGASLLRQGLSASWQVLTGPAAPAIIDACAPHDVLVITPYGRSGSRWMLGSVAEKLVRECPVPVLLVRTPADRPGASS